MAPRLVPLKRFPCTYEDCSASFDSEKEMRSHKKHSPEHDYCSKCNEDFESLDDLNQHKAFRPDKHHLACRVCGDEFKSPAGLKLHIEIVCAREYFSRITSLTNSSATKSIRSCLALAVVSNSFGLPFLLSTSSLVIAPRSLQLNFKDTLSTST